MKISKQKFIKIFTQNFNNIASTFNHNPDDYMTDDNKKRLRFLEEWYDTNQEHDRKNLTSLSENRLTQVSYFCPDNYLMRLVSFTGELREFLRHLCIEGLENGIEWAFENFACNKYSKFLCYTACKEGHLSLAQYLYQKNPFQFSKEFTNDILYTSHFDVVEWMDSLDSNLFSKKNVDILSNIVRFSCKEMIQFMLKKNPYWSLTYSHLRTACLHNSDIEVIKFLEEKTITPAYFTKQILYLLTLNNNAKGVDFYFKKLSDIENKTKILDQLMNVACNHVYTIDVLEWISRQDKYMLNDIKFFKNYDKLYDSCIKHNEINNILWLEKQASIYSWTCLCSIEQLCLAVSYNSLTVIEHLCKKYINEKSQEDFNKYCIPSIKNTLEISKNKTHTSLIKFFQEEYGI